MERLAKALTKLIVSRFLALYGIGVTDSYLATNLVELDLQSAFVSHLKNLGYARLIYTSPTQPLYFLDDQSRDLSQSLIWSPSQNDPDDHGFQTFQPGPYGNKLLLPTSVDFSVSSMNSIGDTHLLHLLDSAMRDEDGPKTVIIINQAENYILHNSDTRTLSSLIGAWQSLPARNKNRCIFLFSANDYTQFADLAISLPVPELRSLILSNHNNRKANISIHNLGGPEFDEAERLLTLITHQNWVDLDKDMFEPLVDQICVTADPLRTWIERFSNTTRINREVALSSGWFSQFRGDLTPASLRLDKLIGLETVKLRIKELAAWASRRRTDGQGSSHSPLLHMVFTGNPGTGKTTIARLTGELFYDLKILKKGHLVETKASDLIADHVGGTAIKTNQRIDEAIGGILFIDEAYSLSEKDRGGFGAEALETLLTRMEDDRDQFVVVLAGYPDQIRRFIQSNPGLSRRFPVENRFEFEDFTGDQLTSILISELHARQLLFDDRFLDSMNRIIDGMLAEKNPQFGNAGEIRNMVDSLERRCLSRSYFANNQDANFLTLEDISPEYLTYLPKEIPSISEILSELDQLVGLEEVKTYLNRKITRLQFEKIRSNGTSGRLPNSFQHLIFTGNPGTGKTTIARLIGKIYASLGLLRKGQTVEVSMPDLVAGYVGQTTGKVIEQINKAVGGVLFIDEAYALVRGNSMFQGSFGQEVIDTLVKAIEDHRGNLLVILAGYPHEMDILMRSNPGLKSRFAPPLLFPDFSSDEAGHILDRLLVQDQLSISDDARSEFLNQLESKKQTDPTTFGNAREIISSYERVKDRLAERVMKSRQMNSISRESKNLSFEIVLEDVRESEFTVVIDGRNGSPAQQKSPLKSWVIPKE